ncbi:methyltransferase domain-containing protein, partial [Shewanella sp.]|uniref:methyltransferase domain-containing protein n=1 Tax=Shewanella sp. TaxID=50422 RepID=UPI0035664DFA
LCGDILSGGMDGGGFDALVSMLVFLHIPDRASLLGRCHDALRPGGALFVEDYYQRGPLSAVERRALAEKVYCRYLPDFATYRAQLRAAGFTAIELRDRTESWAGFVAERLAGFRAERERLIALHGRDLVDSLDDFYATVDGLFAGGNLGGVRIFARRA